VKYRLFLDNHVLSCQGILEERQPRKEIIAINVIGKNFTAFDSTSDNVVKNAGGIEPGVTRHGKRAVKRFISTFIPGRSFMTFLVSSRVSCCNWIVSADLDNRQGQVVLA